MAVLKSKDGTNFFIDCHCGCNDGVRVKVQKDDFIDYCFLTYTNGNFYSEQGETVWRVILKKLEKIWAIVRDKDFYYSDIVMTKDEFDEFRDYLNSLD